MNPFAGWAQVGDGQTTRYSPAATALGESIYAFAVQSGTIKVCSGPFGHPWQKWAELGGLVTDSSVAAKSLSGRLYEAARGTSDHLVYVNSAADGHPFGSWTLVPGSLLVGGLPRQSPNRAY